MGEESIEWSEYTLASAQSRAASTPASRAQSEHRHARQPEGSPPGSPPGPRGVPHPEELLPNYSAQTFLELGIEKMRREKAWANHVVRRAISEARIFEVRTITTIKIYTTTYTLIKIRQKIAGCETLNVRTAMEARALARYEAKGLMASAHMAALTNPGGDNEDMAEIHQAILGFTPIRLRDSI